MALGILGNYGHNNLGDEAILSGMLVYYTKKYSHIIVFSDDMSISRNEEYPPEVELCDFRRSDGGKLTKALMLPFDINKSLSNIEHLIIGGGGLFNDSYKYTILFYFITILIARCKGLKVSLSGISVGPIKSRRNHVLMYLITKLCHQINARDYESVEYFRKIQGTQNKLSKCDDYALFSMPSQSEIVSKRVCLNLIPYCSNIWFMKDPKTYNLYLEYIYKIYSLLIEKGYKVVFFPINTKHDNYAINDLISKFELNDKDYERPNIMNTTELKYLIASSELVVCSRLHACVLSQLHSIEYIPIAYQEKVTNFCSQFDTKYSLKLDDELSSHKILEILNER